MEQPFQNSVALMGLAVYHILSQRPPFRYEPHERRQDAVKKRRQAALRGPSIPRRETCDEAIKDFLSITSRSCYRSQLWQKRNYNYKKRAELLTTKAGR